jgi:hypothetical protein
MTPRTQGKDNPGEIGGTGKGGDANSAKSAISANSSEL